MAALFLNFPKHRNFHFAFITRDLDAGVRSFERIYGDQARIFTGQRVAHRTTLAGGIHSGRFYEEAG